MKRNKYLKVIISIALLLSLPVSSIAKEMPLNLVDLVNGSELIAIVDVFEIESQGKSKASNAKAIIRKTLVGYSENNIIDMNWNGISITELGQWIVFLKKDLHEYRATNGTRSFWKIDNAILDKGECCSLFIVNRSPVKYLNIDPNLFSNQLVYIDDLPRESNPIKLSGIEVKKLESYIQSITKKD
ncbi:hypothetical protein N8878_04615 [Psychromonas sp.]|nr:hypothetical protein [Psychromonas sp.]